MSRSIFGLFLFASCVAFIISLIALIIVTTRKNEVVVLQTEEPFVMLSSNGNLLIDQMQNGSFVFTLNNTNSCPAIMNETTFVTNNTTFFQNTTIYQNVSLVSLNNNVQIVQLENGTYAINVANETCQTVVCDGNNTVSLTSTSDALIIEQVGNGTFEFSLNVSCSCVNVTNNNTFYENSTHYQNVSLVSLNSNVHVNQLENGTFTIDLVNGTCQTVVCGNASTCSCVNATNNNTFFQNTTVYQNVSLISLNSNVHVIQLENGTYTIDVANETCQTVVCDGNSTFSLTSTNNALTIHELETGIFEFSLNCSCSNVTNNNTFFQNTTIQQNVSLIGGTGIHVEQLSNGTFQINSTDTWFNASMPSEVFTMEETVVPNTGTMQVDLKEQEQQTFFAGPTAGSKKRNMATPTFRPLAFSDLPALPENHLWLGNQTVQLAVQANSGLSLSNATFSTTGMLQYLQTAMPAANTFLAGNGTGAAYRALLTSDLPTITGNGINVTMTGTNILLNASQCELENTMPDGTTTFVNTFTSTNACSKVRLSNINHDQLRNYVSAQHVDHSTVSISAGFGLLGGGTIAASRTLSLDLNALPQPNMTNATGLLSIAQGGTNSAAALSNGRIIVSSGGALVEANALTNGQLLVGSTGSAPVATTITAGNAMQVTNAAGSITVAYSHKENIAAITAPAVTDSTSNGYSIGSVWINTVSKTPYICTDATAGAAVWRNMLLPYSDLVQADDTIACSTSSFILSTGMTITPPAGTYMVTFAVGGLTHGSLDASISIRIYMDGAVASATMLWWRGGLAAAVAGTATAIAKVTVNGSQAIEGRWSSSTSTANMRGRTLAIVQTNA